MGIGKRAVIGFCMIVLAGVVGAGVVAAEELGAKRPAPRPETLAAPFIDGAEAAGVKEAPALAAPQVQPAIAKPRVPPRDPTRGSVTNLPLPRFVSLKGNEGNARRGPGLTHRIDWVFTRSGMPLRITAEYEHWRRIEDADGAGGWVHYALLSGVRSALVTADVADFRDAPRDDAEVSFQAERNVVGWIQECVPDWCRLSVDGEKGWVRTSALWGVDPGEVIE
ncbi:SH3 domain-containing protein [Paragemmobacter aquarius]|nr:SH3 domain-containing protein [Gemmobacter aquarius]